MGRFAVLALLLVAGCANVADPSDLRPPRTAAEMQEFNEQKVRSDRVVARLWSAGRFLCKAEAGCMTPYIGTSTKVGAFAGPKGFALSTGLLRSLKTDDEIALVTGHEWAHVLLDHNGAGDIRRNELEADCVGTAITMLAGYDMRVSLNAFRDVFAPLEKQQQTEKIALLFLGVVPTGKQYPSAAERVGSMERAAIRISDRYRNRHTIGRETINEICGVRL